MFEILIKSNRDLDVNFNIIDFIANKMNIKYDNVEKIILTDRNINFVLREGVIYERRTEKET